MFKFTKKWILLPSTSEKAETKTTRKENKDLMAEILGISLPFSPKML